MFKVGKKILMYSVILFVFTLVLAGFIINKKIYPVDFGISFSKTHAESLDLNWREVYSTMLTDLKPKYVRIIAAWNNVEQNKDKYNFDNLDWQMNEALKNGAKITLVVGQKAPRWPECHIPVWVDYNNQTKEEIKKELFDYITAVVKRYKNHKALEIWQVENEPFINFSFGECINYEKDWVKEEVELVRNLDTEHKIMITDSGELSSWRKSIKAGDLFGTTVYRVVSMPNGMYLNYNWFFPAIFYKLKALFWGRSLDNFYVSELQAEPWFATGDPKQIDIQEQEKSMNPERLQKNMDFVTHIGVSRAYLWGVEWWYFTKQSVGDSRYWDIIKNRLEK